MDLPCDDRPSSETTAPGNLTKQPLTCPPAEQQKSSTPGESIFQDIAKHRSGGDYTLSPWQRYKLSPAEYHYVEQRLEAEHTVRFDYFPSTSTLVLRMPSTLHEEFKSRLVDDVLQQLRSITQENGVASEFAQRITHGGSAGVPFHDPADGRHEPDEQFRYPKVHFPTVILEISYPPKKKDLKRLAHDYILGSNGNIGVVLAIDVEYKGKAAAATWSMWQPRLQVNSAGEEELTAHPTVADQEFRTAHGEVSSQPGLRLQLDDWVPSAFLPKDTKLGKDIYISSAALCAYLAGAEELESAIKQGTAFAEPLKPGVKKRRAWSSSSNEDLTKN